MRVFQIAGLLIVASLGPNGCGPATSSSVVQASRASNPLAETNSGLPVEIRAGDPGTSYASVEFTRDGRTYLVAGVDAKPLLRVSRYNSSSGRFSQQNDIRVPAASQLATPALAQSFEPVFKGGRILGTYQVNDGSGDARSDRPAGRFQGRAAGRFQAGGAGPSGFINTAFQSPGEIWLADLTDPSRPQVRLSGTAPLIRTEPEPLSGTNTKWVFYNTAPLGSTLLRATWQLRRSQVP